MNIVAYIITAVALTITIILLSLTIDPLIKKTIKLDNKKIILWFTGFLILTILELLSIGTALAAEILDQGFIAPGYIWLIFKILSLVFLWFWSFCYFFVWSKFKQNKKE